MSTKDFLDFSLDADNDSKIGEGGPVTEVIFSGIAIVLQMVKPELLQVIVFTITLPSLTATGTKIPAERLLTVSIICAAVRLLVSKTLCMLFRASFFHGRDLSRTRVLPGARIVRWLDAISTVRSGIGTGKHRRDEGLSAGTCIIDMHGFLAP
eukprot:SAG31_NODE_2670_length_5271_cov_4.007541_3_plen_153_part_00